MADFLNIAIGPGDCVCTDFSDLSRLSGVNLPEGLEKLIAQWLSEKPDPYAGLESDSDSDRRRRYYVRAPARELNGDLRQDRVVGRTDKNETGTRGAEEIVIRRHDDENEATDAKPPGRSLRRDSDRDGESDSSSSYIRPTGRDETGTSGTRSRRRQITSLAFGSRVGDYAIIYEDEGELFLDGNIFERLSTLKDFIIPRDYQSNSQGRSRIVYNRGAKPRVFLGPENTYFAWDGRFGEFSHNIQTREFRDWVDQCRSRGDRTRRELDDKPSLERGYTPHSLALGPDDMFCWIAEKDFKVNLSFRKAFPNIERFLKYAKSKGILEQVSFTTSSYSRPGSTLPYFVLSTLSGICVSAVPNNATELVSESSTRWGALLSAKRSHDAKKDTGRDRSRGDPTQADKDAARTLIELDPKIRAAAGFAAGGGLLPRSRHPNQGQILDVVVSELENISTHCDENAVDSNLSDWREGRLSERVHIVIEDLKKKATPEDKEAAKILEQLSSDLTVAAAYAIPNSAMNRGKYSKQIGQITTELLLIHKVCDANAINEDSDEWQTATIGERVRQVVGDLKRKIKSTEATNGDVDDTSNLVIMAVILDPEGDLSVIPQLKHLPPESLKELRRIINDIQRTAENVKGVLGDDELVSKMSLADQIQCILAETVIRGQILEKCEKAVAQIIGRDEKGNLSLPDKIEFIISDYIINTTYLGKLNKAVDEVTADDEDISKLPLSDKINIIIANNYAQAEEFEQIEKVLEDTVGKDGYGPKVPRVNRIKILAERNDQKDERLVEIDKQVNDIIGKDGYSPNDPIASKIDLLGSQKSAYEQELTKIGNIVNEVTGKDELISKLSLPDKITTIIADNFAKAQELTKYTRMIKDIGEQVNHLKDGDIKHKLRDILKRK